MYIALAIFASLLGLFVTGAAIFTAWTYAAARRDPSAHPASADIPKSWLLRWSIVDFAVLLLFGCGTIFLIVDAAAVARDKELFPPYHYAYLLCGLIFCVMGMLFAAARIVLLLRLTSDRSAANRDANKPNEAQHAE